jgi:hypothetical protein
MLPEELQTSHTNFVFKANKLLVREFHDSSQISFGNIQPTKKRFFEDIKGLFLGSNGVFGGPEVDFDFENFNIQVTFIRFGSTEKERRACKDH